MNLLTKANGNLPRTEAEKKLMIDNAAIYYGLFLNALGFDYAKDPQTVDTPKRVAKAWVNDLISGSINPLDDVTTFPNEDNFDGIVFQGDIEVVSMCAHHNLAFVGRAYVSYIPVPNGKVIGLSKLNRIVEWFSRRPQMQESLTQQIHTMISELVDNQGVAVMITAKHSCCSNRGVGHDSSMTTSKLSGFFWDNPIGTRDEFYQMVANLK